jgi:hypothetical protein
MWDHLLDKSRVVSSTCKPSLLSTYYLRLFRVLQAAISVQEEWRAEKPLAFQLVSAAFQNRPKQLGKNSTEIEMVRRERTRLTFAPSSLPLFQIQLFTKSITSSTSFMFSAIRILEPINLGNFSIMVHSNFISIRMPVRSPQVNIERVLRSRICSEPLINLDVVSGPVATPSNTPISNPYERGNEDSSTHSDDDSTSLTPMTSFPSNLDGVPQNIIPGSGYGASARHRPRVPVPSAITMPPGFIAHHNDPTYSDEGISAFPPGEPSRSASFHSDDSLIPGVWPSLEIGHPLYLFYLELRSILDIADYTEIWGIVLKPYLGFGPPDFHTLLILQKFLRSNENDVDKAKVQLQKTLVWRREFDPARAMDEIFSKEKFGGMGYVTSHQREDGFTDVVTWNIYGAVDHYKKAFDPLEE